MSGIAHLQDLYHKNGNDFIKQLFGTYVTVNEKMDGSAFTFERDSDTGKFRFFKRDQRNPITLVDRTLMRYYEKPIQYIESLPPHIIQKIPRGWRFGLEYFSSPKPVEIAYDRMPKNNLILSYVHKIENGKIKKTIQDKNELETWADILGIERPPIIFQGYLSEDQKSKILEFINTPFSDLVSEFKTRSFVSFIVGVLNPKLERTTLNNDLEKSIEGIVFRFGKEDENEPVLAKMVDPVFTELAKTKYAQRKENKPSDFLGITVLDVMNFILEKGVDSFEVEGKSEDEKYLSFMSDVFVNFLDENSEKYKEADFDEPQYLKKDEFRVNKDMVSNRAALKYIEEDDAFESLFKLIINQFRKIKKRTGGIINQNVIEQFNSVVKNIEDRIGRKDKINESVLPSFRDFKDQFRKKVDYITEENDDDGLENYGIVPDGSFDDFITDLDTIEKTPVENKMPLREFKEDPSLTPTNIIVGRFQPFHNGHLNMAKQLKEKNGITSMAVVVYPGHNKSGKSPFKEEIIRKYMESVVRDNPDYLNSFLIVTKGLLGIIAGEARKRGYRIELIGAGDDRSEDFEKQVDYLKKAGKEFPDDAKVFQTKRMIKGADARKHIERDDFTAFKKMVPPGVSSIYPVLSSAIKGTDVTNESESEFDFEKNIRKIYENISTFDFDSFSEKELDQKKIKKILAKARSAEVLLKSLLNENYISENLFENLRLSFFGKSYGANINQNEYIEEFVSSVSESTIENLSKRIEGNFENDLISFDSVLEAGSLDINQLSNFNGIDRSDLQEIYAMDSRFPSGRKRRGKGESLTAIAFGGKHYYEIEADVLIEGIRVEVKTTINSGIDAENEANKIDSKIIEAFKLFSEYLGENKELLENKMQKNTLDLITSKLSSDTAKSRNSIIGKLKKILEFKDIKEASDVGPALICRQLNWYSESQGFDVLAIYAEREGFPEKLMLLDGRKGFMNPKNLSILKENNVNPKVIQGRMEIYKTI